MELKRRKEIFEQLSKPFDSDCIQRDSKAKTYKKYNAVFIKYQYLANRLSELLGAGGWEADLEVLDKWEGKTKGAKPIPNYHVMGKMTLKFYSENTCLGGNAIFATYHNFCDAVSVESMGSAHKAAYTDGFKKVCGLAGCGWRTYANLLDPYFSEHGKTERVTTKSTTKKKTNTTPPKAKEEPKATPKSTKADWSDIMTSAKNIWTKDVFVNLMTWIVGVKPEFKGLKWDQYDPKNIPKIHAHLLKTFPPKEEEIDLGAGEVVNKETGEVTESPMSDKQRKTLHALYKKNFADNTEERKRYMKHIVGVESTKDLDKSRASKLIDSLMSFDPMWDLT